MTWSAATAPMTDQLPAKADVGGSCAAQIRRSNHCGSGRVNPPYGFCATVLFQTVGNFYGTNQIDDSSTISKTAWNASKPYGKRPDRDAFLQNEANGDLEMISTSQK